MGDHEIIGAAAHTKSTCIIHSARSKNMKQKSTRFSEHAVFDTPYSSERRAYTSLSVVAERIFSRSALSLSFKLKKLSVWR